VDTTEEGPRRRPSDLRPNHLQKGIQNLTKGPTAGKKGPNIIDDGQEERRTEGVSEQLVGNKKNGKKKGGGDYIPSDVQGE